VVIIMTSISVTLSNDRLLKLQEIAARLGVTPEDLVRISIEELLARPDDVFQQAVDYVLNKNAELYRRLA
jgi:predicted transcriptional regulator